MSDIPSGAIATFLVVICLPSLGDPMSEKLDSGQLKYQMCPLLHAKPLLVTQFIRPMRGKSRSWAVYGEDHQVYVLKFNGNVRNRNLLANEAIGVCILDGLGIPVPKCRRLIVSPVFFKDACLKETLAEFVPAESTHFGSAYVGNGKTPVWDYVAFQDARYDDHAALGVLLFDLWCNNLDTRQAVHMRNLNPREQAMIFIDNSDICGGAAWSFNRTRSGHPFSHPQYIPQRDPRAIEYWCRRFKTRIPPLLEAVVDILPQDWYIGDIDALVRNLLQRLEDIHEIVASANWDKSLVA
jgi:hypothetical protein